MDGIKEKLWDAGVALGTAAAGLSPLWVMLFQDWNLLMATIVSTGAAIVTIGKGWRGFKRRRQRQRAALAAPVQDE